MPDTPTLDVETLAYLRERVALEANLAPEWAPRLKGRTLGEMRSDAAQLARSLGLVEPQPRDGSGRFAAAMNARLRTGR